VNDAQLSELELVFRFALRLPDDVALAGVNRERWSAWDSMAQVQLVSALENQFDLQIDVHQAMKLDSWDACVAFVAQKLAP
jgi:acyl carrier protein